MRLIDADLIQYDPMLSPKGNGQYEEVSVAYKSQIDNLPTIEERKTGKWISLDDFRGKYNTCGYKCSECGEQSDYEENHCPNCGARMEGVADMKIGDHVYVHGYVDEIRRDIIIIRNKGGYFGTASDEVITEPERKKGTPCDLCRYNPPSSGDGKPCSYCPAEQI